MSGRPPSSEIIPDGPVTDSVDTGGSRKGGRMLLSNNGFTYTVKVRFVKVKKNYVAVFQALLKRLEPKVPSVEWIMFDFEAGKIAFYCNVIYI